MAIKIKQHVRVEIIETMPPRCGVDATGRLWYKNPIAPQRRDKEEKMSIDAGVCYIKQPDRSSGKRTRMSAGTWMGEERDGDRGLVVVEAVLTGNAPFAGFPGMAPRVSEPALAMCLRAAAWFVGSPLRNYLPKQRARDFLPFIQPRSCRLIHKRKIVKRIFREEPYGNPAKGKKKRGRPSAVEATRSIELRVLTDWTLTAEIAVALFPGVNEANIRELIAVAGERIGLGMYRPQQNGKFGTFKLAELRVASGAWPRPPANLTDEAAKAAEAAKDVARTVAESIAASGEAEDDDPDHPIEAVEEEEEEDDDSVVSE